MQLGRGQRQEPIGRQTLPGTETPSSRCQHEPHDRFKAHLPPANTRPRPGEVRGLAPAGEGRLAPR